MPTYQSNVEIFKYCTCVLSFIFPPTTCKIWLNIYKSKNDVKSDSIVHYKSDSARQTFHVMFSIIANFSVLMSSYLYVQNLYA